MYEYGCSIRFNALSIIAESDESLNNNKHVRCEAGRMVFQVGKARTIH